MKINMKASDLAKLSIIINGDEHEIYANECLDFDIEEKLVVIEFVKEKCKKRTLKTFFLRLPLRIVRGAFDVLLMNAPEKDFIKKVEPYNFYGKYTNEMGDCKEVRICYKPSAYSAVESKFMLPEIKVNDEMVELKCDFDENSLLDAFQEYCLHFSSTVFYSLLLMTLIFVYSYKSALWLLLLAFVLGIAYLMVYGLLRAHKRYKEIKLDFISEK